MNEFERRCELLSVSLGLKDSAKLSVLGEEGKRNYELLFSTYIKMIEQDQNNFFIDGTKKQKIIDSLKSTLSLSQTDSIRDFTKQLNDLKTDDPHSFILFPAFHNTPNVFAHSSGLIIYKNKQEDYLVTIIDKVDDTSAEYRTISKSKCTDIGEIILENKHRSFEKEPLWVLNQLYKLSNEEGTYGATDLNIVMQKQYIGNCVVNSLEATLKTALFNCRQNIFELSPQEIPITPKWHPTPSSTLEMRERFLNAIKVPAHPKWNQYFDQVFEHYLIRKKKTMKDSSIRKTASERNEEHRKKIALAEDYAKKFAEDKSIRSLKHKLAKQMQTQSIRNEPRNKHPQSLMKESR